MMMSKKQTRIFGGSNKYCHIISDHPTNLIQALRDRRASAGRILPRRRKLRKHDVEVGAVAVEAGAGGGHQGADNCGSGVRGNGLNAVNIKSEGKYMVKCFQLSHAYFSGNKVKQSKALNPICFLQQYSYIDIESIWKCLSGNNCTPLKPRTHIPETAPPISPGMPCKFSTPHVSCSPHELKQNACRRAKPNTATRQWVGCKK
jgi:hypothetical protein